MGLASAALADAGARPPIWLTKGVTTTTSAGKLVSSWAATGNPPAGSYDTTLNGVTLSGATTGAIQRTNPASGASYLYNLGMNQGGSTITQFGWMLLIDRLWHNGGYDITSTSAQNSTTPTWPSRCPTSATDDSPATTGHGVYLGLEVSGATGAGTPTVTVGYTNSGGTASRTATNIPATTATTAASIFYPIGLQAGDVGVRSVQSLTLSATWTSGTINLVAYRIIGLVCPNAQAPGRVGWYTGGSNRIYDDSCLSLLYYASTASGNNGFIGFMQETQG